MSEIRLAQLNNVYQIVKRAGQNGATIQEVAKAMPKIKQKDGSERDMAVTPYLTGMLDQLVAEGYLRKEPGMIQTGRGLRMGWRYWASS